MDCLGSRDIPEKMHRCRKCGAPTSTKEIYCIDCRLSGNKWSRSGSGSMYNESMF